MSQEKCRCNEDADPGLRREILEPQWKPWVLVAMTGFALALIVVFATLAVRCARRTPEAAAIDCAMHPTDDPCRVTSLAHDSALTGVGTAASPMRWNATAGYWEVVSIRRLPGGGQ